MTSYAGLKIHILTGTGQVTAEGSRLGGGAVSVLRRGIPWQEKGKETPPRGTEGSRSPPAGGDGSRTSLEPQLVLSTQIGKAFTAARRNGASKPTLHHRNLSLNKSATAEMKELMAPGNYQQRSWFLICWIHKGRIFFFYIGLAIHFHELLILYV